MNTAPAAFDPAAPGTPDAAWQLLLSQAPQWSPPGSSIVVVAPHPDDEVLGAGGLIHALASEGRAVTILSVTDGEKAHPNWPGLDIVRRKELLEALRTLAPVHVTVQRLGLADGAVVRELNRLRQAVAEFATPDALVLAPYEFDGHPDHEAVGRVCKDVAQAAGAPLAMYPVWAWHHATPAALQAARWGRFVLGAAAQRAKARALQSFRSQLDRFASGPVVPPHVLRYFQRPYEAFVL